MKISSANREYSVIAIFKYQDSFSSAVLNMFAQHRLEYVIVYNVYEAASLAAKKDTNKKLLVIGTVNELSREHGLFLKFCQDKADVQCICYCTGKSGQEKHKVLAAVNSGALVVGEEQELDKALRSLAVMSSRPDKSKETVQKKEDRVEDNIQITAEELEALLGDD